MEDYPSLPSTPLVCLWCDCTDASVKQYVDNDYNRHYLCDECADFFNYKLNKGKQNGECNSTKKLKTQ